MPAKLEWGRSQKWVKSEVRLGDCDCIVTVNLYGKPNDDLITIEIPPGEGIASGKISIRPLFDRDSGGFWYWVIVNVDDVEGFFDTNTIAINLYEAVALALDIARLILERAKGRIEKLEILQDAILLTIDYTTAYLDMIDENSVSPSSFTPAEAREAILTIEEAVMDAEKTGREV